MPSHHEPCIQRLGAREILPVCDKPGFLLLLLDELNDQAVRDTLCALRRELCENEEDGLMEAEEAPPAALCT